MENNEGKSFYEKYKLPPIAYLVSIGYVDAFKNAVRNFLKNNISNSADYSENAILGAAIYASYFSLIINLEAFSAENEMIEFIKECVISQETPSVKYFLNEVAEAWIIDVSKLGKNKKINVDSDYEDYKIRVKRKYTSRDETVVNFMNENYYEVVRQAVENYFKNGGTLRLDYADITLTFNELVDEGIYQMYRIIHKNFIDAKDKKAFMKNMENMTIDKIIDSVTENLSIFDKELVSKEEYAKKLEERKKLVDEILNEGSKQIEHLVSIDFFNKAKDPKYTFLHACNTNEIEIYPSVLCLQKNKILHIAKKVYIAGMKSIYGNHREITGSTDEQMSIYFSYFVISNNPDFSKQLLNEDIDYDYSRLLFSESFDEFMKVYLNSYISSDEYVEDYKASLQELLEENDDTRDLKLDIDPSIFERALKKYYLSGNRLKTDDLDYEITDEMIINSIYNTMVSELCVMTIRERRKYIARINANIPDVIYDILVEYIEKLYNLSSSDENIKKQADREKMLMDNIIKLSESQRKRNRFN